MLEQGVPLVTALDCLAKDLRVNTYMHNVNYSKLTNKIKDSVSQGLPLHEALAVVSQRPRSTLPGLFPATFIAIVEAGEKSDTLVVALKNIVKLVNGEIDY